LSVFGEVLHSEGVVESHLTLGSTLEAGVVIVGCTVREQSFVDLKQSFLVVHE
jgi:hypothetical protein